MLRQAEGAKALALSVLRLARLADAVGAQLVAAQWPGLTSSQAALVAQRAGGSPGLLTEIQQKLQRSRHLFVKSDFSGPLTASGERVVRETTFAYHTLVEERLAQVEADDADGVTPVLRIASYLGMQFSTTVLSDLLGRLAEVEGPASTADGMQRALTRAESPLALIQSLVAQLREFRLPVYREVLERQLRESDELLLAIRAAVLALILDYLEGPPLARLDRAEREVFLSFAAGELSAPVDAGDDTLRGAWLAVLAEQMSMLEGSGRTATLRALVDRWFAAWQPDRALPGLAALNGRVVCVIRTALLVGQPQPAIALAERWDPGVAPGQPADEQMAQRFDVRLLKALALSDVGRRDLALGEQEALLVEAQAQLTARPDDENSWHRFSWVSQSLASALPGSQDASRARALLEQSLAASQERLRRWGPSRERHLSVASDALMLAMQCLEEVRNGGDPQGHATALAHLDDVRRELAACQQAFGADALLLKRQCHAEQCAVEILWARGETDQALKLEQQCAAGFSELIKQFGESADRLLNLSQCHSSYAVHLHTVRGRMDDEILVSIDTAWALTAQAIEVYGALPLRIDHAVPLADIVIGMNLEWDRLQQSSSTTVAAPTDATAARVTAVADSVKGFLSQTASLGGGNPARLSYQCQLLGRIVDVHLARQERGAAIAALKDILAVAEQWQVLEPAGGGVAMAGRSRALLEQLGAV